MFELLSQSGNTLSELLEPYQRYADSGEINTEVADPAATVAAIAETERASGASIDLLDGLTVERADWWYNVRPSNTEPLLRLNVEARTPEACAAHVAEVQELIAAHAGCRMTGPTTGGAPMSLDPLLLDVLACPVDKGPLLWFEDEDVLYNPRLHKSYAVDDGVPVLLGRRSRRRRRRRARAAHGQGREGQGAGHRAGRGVNDWGYLDTLDAWDEAAADIPEQLIRALETARQQHPPCCRITASAAVRRGGVRGGHRSHRL